MVTKYHLKIEKKKEIPYSTRESLQTTPAAREGGKLQVTVGIAAATVSPKINVIYV